MKRYPIARATLAGIVIALLCSVSAAEEVDSVIFVRIPNKPNGDPGMYYEPFMYHFGRSAHVPGAQIVRLSPPAPDGEVTVLTQDFYSVEEPEISYDAKKILFAGQKTAEDEWNVWEMNLDGSGQRQITREMGHVCSPYYLPDGRIVFSSTRHVAQEPERNRDEYDRDYARLIHRCNPDGSNVEQLSFNVSSDSEAIVMRDGRILFQSWQHHGMRFHSSGASAFFTMNPDGTGFIDFFGNHRGGFRWKQREMPDGKVIFIDSVFHHCYGGGRLGMITPGGPDDPTRFENLTPDVKINGPDTPGGRYRDPYPTPDGRLMVSWSPAPAWSAYRNPGGPQVQFSLYWFDFEKKQVGKPIYTDTKYQALNVIPILPQPTPRIIPDHGVDREKTSGVLLCLDAYRGQLDKEAFIQPGQIKKVRIIEGFGIEDSDPFFRTFPPGIGYSSFGSSSNSISNFEQKRVVGEAPVEEDGSFHVEVPADTVLHWQVLDENDMALQDALTWAWVRPGEQRTCVGCHENRENTAGLSRVPFAARRRPTPLNVAREQRYTIDFRRDLTPIIEEKCVRCHDANQAAGDLDLSEGDKLVFQRLALARDRASRVDAAVFNKAYLNLSANANSRLGKLIFPGMARKSPLIWRLHGHSPLYDAKVNQCPPDEPLTAEEKAKFALWVDLGAQWDNLPGEDAYVHFNREESRKLAAQASGAIPAEITEGSVATEMRCMECHDLSKPLAARKTADEWQELVTAMSEKRKGWIKPNEAELIASFLGEITQDAGLIREWKVCGPFENRNGAGIRNEYGPETESDFTKSYPGKGDQSAVWKEVSLKNPTAVLDFESVLGRMDQATAYAAATVRSASDQVVYLRISGDDMFAVIVNGQRVRQRLMPQPFGYDDDVMAINLKQGDNTVLVKVHDQYGPWRMRARLTESPSPTSAAAKLAPTPSIAGAR